MNRGELRSYIQDFGKRTDATDTLVNGFIARAEEMIAARVRAAEMVGNPTTIQETDREAGGRYTLPSDFLGVMALWSSAGYPLRQLGLDSLREYTVNSGAYFFGVYGYNLEIRGAPAEDSTFDLVYFARPAAMSSDTDEPLLLTNHPGLYIHGAMVHYRIWSEDPELASAHADAFGSEVEAVNGIAAAQQGGAPTGRSANLGAFNHRSTM